MGIIAHLYCRLDCADKRKYSNIYLPSLFMSKIMQQVFILLSIADRSYSACLYPQYRTLYMAYMVLYRIKASTAENRFPVVYQLRYLHSSPLQAWRQTRAWSAGVPPATSTAPPAAASFPPPLPPTDYIYSSTSRACCTPCPTHLRPTLCTTSVTR